MDGVPLSGGFLYFFAAASTTPQNAFQDTGLTILHPNPIILDASGRVPMFYLADGNIKIRLTDRSGVTVLAADNLLVIGPAGGGTSGSGGVDPKTVIQVGDIITRFGTGDHPGFLPCNGQTMGNAVSGAVYASADNRALFEHLWGTGVLQVKLGAVNNRGSSASGDFDAGKNIVLPDLRGRAIVGLDDMGTTPVNRLTSTYWGVPVGGGAGVNAITLGNAGGAESRSLAAANTPLHKHQFSFSATQQADSAGGHTHTVTGSVNPLSTANQAMLGVFVGASGTDAQLGSTFTTYASSAFTNFGPTAIADGVATSNGAHTHDLSGTGTTNDPTGTTAQAFGTSTPSMVMTFYIKL
jgi:hypothetical protein